MNFSTATKVLDTIRAGDDVARVRSENRAKVNDNFNSVPPLSESEAKRLKMLININWGEGAVLKQHGLRQYLTAFLKPSGFFRVTIPLAPTDHRGDWGSFITNAINHTMKRSQKLSHLYEYKFSSVLAHGIGPQLWYSKDGWCADYLAINDWRTPTDSTTDFEDLGWFAARHYYSVGSLNKKVFGPTADKAWNKGAIAKMLDAKKEINYDDNSYSWLLNPEKMHELVKQNAGYFNSDAVPKIPLWHFYFYDDDNPRKCSWKLRVVPDVESGATVPYDQTEFLYTTDKPAAKELSHLLHCQFGDLNVDAPFKISAVRALGFMLMEPCYWMNLTRCRLLQHMWENMKPWWRIIDPSGKARAQSIDVANTGIIPEGVSVVPQAERHQIDQNLVAGVMQELRQLMSEVGVSYTQDIHEPGSAEETATKTMAKMQLVNALMGGLLDSAFRQEVFAYREICRRFCLSGSGDPDVRRFQKLCKDEGIPRMWLNEELWEIEPEIPLGAGNPTMAMLESQRLMEIRPMLPPAAQDEVLHEAVEVTTGDSRKAQRWVPTGQKKGATPIQKVAEADFSILMRGLPVNVMDQGLIEQIVVLMGLLAGEIAMLEQSGNVADAREVQGLINAYNHIMGLIQRLAQNPQEKERAGEFEKSLGKLQNSIKGFQQRLAEQQASQNGDPEKMAQIQLKAVESQAKLQAKAADNQLKQTTKQTGFELDQRRREQQHQADLRRKSEDAAIEQSIKLSEAKTEEEIKLEQAAVDAEVKRKQAAAQQSKTE